MIVTVAGVAVVVGPLPEHWKEQYGTCSGSHDQGVFFIQNDQYKKDPGLEFNSLVGFKKKSTMETNYSYLGSSRIQKR